ncbi:MAG: group I intron-associated PD-(D/E)XK endonuclease [Candidatus Sulfotelmatobacter sp.]
MKAWERFGTYKERGEWVELQFMAQAARRRFAVCTPWGETRAYDVGIEHGPNFLRVQVKSSSYRRGDGYCCQLLPNHAKRQDYTLEQIDLFGAYVIPVDAWYLIPASLVLGVRRITCVMLSPVGLPTKKKSYSYERYKEAWRLLTDSRGGLARRGLDVKNLDI